MPLLIRIPGNDWAPTPEEPSFHPSDAVALSLELSKLGIDLIDVSSAGLLSTQKIISGPGYQAPFARAVKEALKDTNSNVVVSTVGMITSGKQAEELLQDGSADAVMVARAFLKDPGLVWSWAAELGVEVRVAEQIGWGFGQRPDGGVKGGKAPAARG